MDDDPEVLAAVERDLRTRDSKPTASVRASSGDEAGGLLDGRDHVMDGHGLALTQVVERPAAKAILVLRITFGTSF